MSMHRAIISAVQQQTAPAGGITFVGSYIDHQASNQTDITLTLPTPHQANDFGIIFIAADASTDPGLTIDTPASSWTELRHDHTTPGLNATSAIFYRKFTSSSETNPVISTDTSEERSVSVHVFRGVDTTTAFDVTEQYESGENDALKACPAITTVTDNSCLVLIHHPTHNDVTAVGLPTTPAELTEGESVIGTGNDRRHQIVAYKLNAGTAGTTTPTAWTHTTTSDVIAEYHVYTLALRPA